MDNNKKNLQETLLNTDNIKSNQISEDIHDLLLRISIDKPKYRKDNNSQENNCTVTSGELEEQTKQQEQLVEAVAEKKEEEPKTAVAAAAAAAAAAAVAAVDSGEEEEKSVLSTFKTEPPLLPPQPRGFRGGKYQRGANYIRQRYNNAVVDDSQSNNNDVGKNADKKKGRAGNGPTSSSRLIATSRAMNYVYARKKQTHNDYDSNSVYALNSKKQNYNHLLNFHYNEHNVSGYTGGYAHDYQYEEPLPHKRYNDIATKTFNKELFLQANFQFVIRLWGKPLFTASPDELIKWLAIVQVNIHTTEEPRCPICLCPPVAAKLTPCGHVYCWPCILHYIDLDKKSCKCTICFQLVDENELKSCTIIQQKHMKEGDTIKLQLMHRKKGSLYIEKVKHENQMDIYEHFPFMSDEEEEQKLFSKFLLAEHDDILKILKREENELLMYLVEGNCSDAQYVNKALNMLAVQIKSLKFQQHNKDDELKSLMKKEEDNKEENLTNKYFYFYQSTDGQHIYLHPLNVKMLQACYDYINKGPLTIEGRILQMEHYTINEQTRRKFTCINHLPLTCQFAVVELDLLPPIVTADIYALFSDAISTRQNERERRKDEDIKRSKEIEKLSTLQMDKVITEAAKIDISSATEFPSCFEVFDEFDFADIPTTSTYSAALLDNTAPNTTKELWPALPTPQKQLAHEEQAQQSSPSKVTLSTLLTEAIHIRKQQRSGTATATTSATATNANAVAPNGNTKKSKQSKKMKPLYTTDMKYKRKD